MADQMIPGNADELAQLIAYLRQHSDQYSLEALRNQLLASGRDPALVERAIAEVRGEQPHVTNRPIWPSVLLLVLANVFGLSIVTVGCISLVSNFDSSGGLFLLGVLIGPAVILGELIWGIVIMNGPEARKGRILVFGALFSIIVPFALGALLFGLCIVILGGLSFQ